MDEVLINTKADMRWLRDVHLPKLPSRFKSAVLAGNEDAPDRIDVYSRREPLITDTPVTFVQNKHGVYVRER